MVMRWIVCCPMVWLCLAAPAPLPPLGGSIHDSEYNVAWNCTAEQSFGWNIRYTLQNLNKSYVRIIWADATGNYIYNGWLEQTPHPIIVGSLDIGALQPD